MALTYLGSPYGASPMTLYSPEFTLEAGVVREGRIEETEEWGKCCSARIVTLLPQPTPYDEVAFSPTPSIVDEGGLPERRGKESGGGVGLVMLRIDDGAIVAELFADKVAYPRLLPDPQGDRHEKRPGSRAARRRCTFSRMRSNLRSGLS